MLLRPFPYYFPVVTPTGSQVVSSLVNLLSYNYYGAGSPRSCDHMFPQLLLTVLGILFYPPTHLWLMLMHISYNQCVWCVSGVGGW